MKGLLQSLVKQGSTNTASGTLLTAMSRLADESKTDRAPLRSAHRKRKMQEAPPSAAAAGLNKLKPSTMSLPPVSMPKQAYKPAPAVPMHASAVCRPDVAHPDIAANSGHSQPQLSSQPMQSNTASQSSMSANKRAKHEQGYDNTVSQLRPLAEYAAKSDDDAETETDGSSQHVRAAQRPACTVSSSSNVLPAATTFFDPVKALPLTAQVLTHPQSNAHKPEAVFHRLADQLLGQSSVAQRSVAASDSTALPVATLPATDNSMAVLAHAAAAASEGGAETTSSRADTEDDKGAAAILRDLRSSPSPQPSPVADIAHQMKGQPMQSMPEAPKGRNRTARLLPATITQAQCVACGRPGKSMLQCAACDCFYHLRCAAPETKRNLTDGVPWLCENCFSGQ